jgi:predicted Zn-dependent peptidase
VTFQQEVLDNGLTVIGEQNPAALSMAAGYFVRTGGRDETAVESGVSHFLEHMLFKGTERRTAEDVNREFDEIGADYNAFTSEENTVYYGAVLPEHQNRLIDLLTDMMRPTLRVEDFDMEKNVILEEIALYKDRPQFTVIDEARAHFYANHPLGHSVLGTTETVSALQREQMVDYCRRRYGAGNLLCVLTGDFDWKQALDHIKKTTRGWDEGDTNRNRPAFAARAGVKVVNKPDVARAHLAFVSPGVSAQSEDRFLADIVSLAIGGGDGSRLFWELTDPGKADSVRLSHEEEDGAGSFFGYASCDPGRTQEVLDSVRKVLLQTEEEGIRDDEIERARRKIASALVIHDETPRGRLFHFGFEWQYRSRYRSVDEEIDRYLSVTREEVNQFLERRPFDVISVTALGPLTELS